MANQNIRHTLDVSGGQLPEGFKARLNIEIDFSGCSNDEFVKWALSNRVIALQRNLRTLPTATLNDMAKNGHKVHARDCGKKIVSREQRIQDAVAMYHVSENVATIIVDDPDKFAKLMAEVEQKVSKK